MAEGNVSGLGRFKPYTNPYAQQYVKQLQDAGDQFSKAAEGFVKAKAEVRRREVEAKSQIQAVDFSDANGPKGIFAADAAELKARIDGDAEDSYDFSNVNDIKRFENDLAEMNSSLSGAEPVWTGTIENMEKLEAENSVMAQLGNDPRQAPSQTVNGVEVYNTKSTTENFNENLRQFNALKDANFEKIDGKYVAKDSEGNIIRTYNTKEEYFQEIAELGKPDLAPVPIRSAQEAVSKDRVGSQYKEESKAKAGFTEWVKNHDLEAKRAYVESLEPGEDGTRMKIADVDETVGEDGLTDYQREYRDAMLEEWRREQKAPDQDENLSRSAKVKTGYLQQAGPVAFNLNELTGDDDKDAAIPEEDRRSVGGFGFQIPGNTPFISGNQSGGNMQTLYVDDNGFKVVIQNPQGVQFEVEVPLAGSSSVKQAVASGLGMSVDDLTSMMIELQGRADAASN